MPRGPRIDEPGLIHHVIARGIEQKRIFSDDEDAGEFVARLARIVPDTGVQVLSFALIPNHVHLLLRRMGQVTVSTLMQRLLTGYAIYFNRTHSRAGHLFQNRYQSIACRSEMHLLELIRYINLNPIRAGLVDSLDELSQFSFASHSLLMKNKCCTWFDSGRVMIHFGSNEAESRREYLDFISAGLREELSLEKPMAAVCSEKEDHNTCNSARSKSDIRKRQSNSSQSTESKRSNWEMLLSEICTSYSISRSDLFGASRRRELSKARAHLAFRMSSELGFSGSEVGRCLAVTRSAASKMISRGAVLERARIKQVV